jgi:hypothetical protein
MCGEKINWEKSAFRSDDERFKSKEAKAISL